MNESAYGLMSKSAYLAELVKRIDAAQEGERVMVTTMAFVPQLPETRAVTEALAHAARRGLSVRFLTDAYPLLFPDNRRLGPLFWHRTLPGKLHGEFADVAEALEDLRRSGVEVVMLNKPSHAFTIPVAGRSHLKCAVVGGWTAIGGCNFDSPGDIDLMATGENTRVADWLWTLVDGIAARENVRKALGDKDRSFDVNPTTKLMVDAGVPGQSMILQEVVRQIDEAREWVLLTCQYFPNDLTARHLLAAHRRGVKVTVVFNRPDRLAPVDRWLVRPALVVERFRLPDTFFAHMLTPEKPFLHAKLLATENGAIVGSHNFVRAGVRLGTAEIALRWHDQKFAQTARAELQRQLGL